MFSSVTKYLFGSAQPNPQPAQNPKDQVHDQYIPRRKTLDKEDFLDFRKTKGENSNYFTTMG